VVKSSLRESKIIDHDDETHSAIFRDLAKSILCCSLFLQKYNHDTSRFIFELPDNLSAGLSVASCVLTQTPPSEEGKKPVIRPYTPIGDGPGFIEFLIKYYPNGNASKSIHNLRVGDTLKIKGPIPKWPYKANEFQVRERVFD
jgi:hypothetical protein